MYETRVRRRAPHVTLCVDPIRHVIDALGEVMRGLKTMSDCTLVGKALDMATSSRMERIVVKNIVGARFQYLL